jgi:alpha-methylacyl-CoA racemase
VLIEPFRPGVLESLDLSPATLLKHNPRLIIARLTGFRRDGKYKDMAGHDINYLAVSGILSRLGRPNERPQPPANLLGDFAGGGLMCAFGIVMALFARTVTGKGQVVEENMVDAVSSIGAFVRLGRSLAFAGPRGTNLLDGGSPFYDKYETKDMGLADGRMEKQNWPRIRDLFEKTFKSKTRDEWERVFDGTDACCTPVLEHEELRKSGHQIREAVTLTDTPGVDVVEKESWVSEGLGIGEGGEDTLREWLGWQRGREYLLEKGALVAAPGARL